MNSFDFHKQAVVERFSCSAHDYDAHGDLQQRVANQLADLLPEMSRPRVLEIGCGTGFLTRHLINRYPDGAFLITDLSQDMLDVCTKSLGRHNSVRYTRMDGEYPDLNERFDLIVSSMAAQWFTDCAEGLTRQCSLLQPGGQMLYATVGPDVFPQWRNTLEELGLPIGLIEVPELPCIIQEEYYQMRYPNGLAFLKNLRSTGASQPRQGYSQLTAGHLRQAIRLFEAKAASTCDWHIQFGRIRQKFSADS